MDISHKCHHLLLLLYAPLSTEKQLAESLILARLDKNDAVCSLIPAYLNKRLQRVQLVTAGFVLNRYARERDILSLGWLPIPERKDFHLLKLAHKALYSPDWPA